MADIKDTPALLFAYSVEDRRAREIGWDEVRAAPAPGAWRWIGLNRHHADTAEWLTKESGVPAHAVRALLAEETRPRAIRMGGGLVIILRGVNLNPGAAPEDMISARLWLEPERVISVQLRRLKALSDARAALKAPETTPENAGALTALIAARLVDRMEPVIREELLTIDAFEEESLTDAGAAMREKLTRLRHDAIILRRFLAPQRDLLHQLNADTAAPFDERARLDLREIADRVTRLVEELDSVRDRASVIQDQLANRRAEEMNRNMMILSVVAAIFLPLSFLTGLLGINVGGMPGADDPVAFWIVVALCLVLGAALAFYFRKRQWL